MSGELSCSSWEMYPLEGNEAVEEDILSENR